MGDGPSSSGVGHTGMDVMRYDEHSRMLSLDGSMKILKGYTIMLCCTDG